MELKTIIEAILFAAGRAVGLGEILAVLEAVVEGPRGSRQEIEAVLEGLEKEYQGRGGGVELVRVAEGWELRTPVGFAPWVMAVNRPRPQRLTTSAVETMAMIAYRQPITRGEIEAIRGVDSAAVLKGLVERRLIRILGRKEEPGRPLLYGTTKEFLELFGLNDLSALPPMEEFEEKIKKQAVVEEGEDFSLADLAATPEEILALDGDDQELLSELDSSMKELKEKEQQVVIPPEGLPPESQEE